MEKKQKLSVCLRGGSIGEIANRKTNVIKTFNTPEEAKQYAKDMNKILSPGEKSYYKLRYYVSE